MTRTARTWTFKLADTGANHLGAPTDARGLELRRQCGYGWVRMSAQTDWQPLAAAIRQAERMERGA